ncbi:MAG: hypothetical protein CMD65_03025 [Gammaproteobacteria bacterium]|nr:hypothetical protein [Gammaproteobacteria bacterium]
MQNTVENTLDKIKRTGFSVETNILSENDIKILTEECKKILLNDKKDIELKFNNNNFKKYNISETIQTNYNTKVRHLAGISKEVDNILNKFLLKNEIKDILNKVLGDGYKLYSCGLRNATHKSSYVGLHTDADYQFSISIFLNDISATNPTTVFYKKTHLLPFKFASKFESINIKFFAKNLIPATGKKGDILFFFNKTLHGMKQSDNDNDNSTVILLCFHPAGYPHKPWNLPNSSYYDQSFLNGLGKELKKLFDNNLDLYTSKDGELMIKETNNNSGRIIDSISSNNNYNVTDYFKTINWWISYSISIIYRIFRKISRTIYHG